jgi:hypothetical protein
MATIDSRLDLDIDSLPMDVFELVSSGLEVETLTAGHGMAENAASTCFCSSGACAPSCSLCIEVT